MGVEFKGRYMTLYREGGGRGERIGLMNERKNE